MAEIILLFVGNLQTMRNQRFRVSLSRRTGRFLSMFRELTVEQLLVLAPLVAAFQGALWTTLFAVAGDRAIKQHQGGLSVGLYTLILGLAWLAISIAAAKWRHGRYWPSTPRVRGGPGNAVTKALLWSLIGWFAWMTYPAWLALSRNPYSGVTWLTWGLEDNRWLVAFYLVTIACAVILPPLFARLFERQEVYSFLPAARARHWAGRTAIAMVLGTGLSLALFAPPWNIERGTGQVGNHDVHLSQLQAIHKGSTPYVGPASIQYGPGSQMLQYAHMTLSGKFSLAGYRESYALATLLGFAIFSTISIGVLGLVYGSLASLLALYISPFLMFNWSGQIFQGSLGWGNPFRYLGAFVVMALMPSLVTATRGWRNYPALVVGIVWGFFSWMSQENLTITALSVGLFLVVAWSLGCYTFGQIRVAVVNGVVGFAAFWLPVLAYYFGKGELVRFVEGYFLVSRFVAAGMSNTPWEAKYNQGWNATFYLTPYFLLAAAWVTMVDWSKRKFLVPLPAERQRLLAFICLSLVCFTGALFRKDSSHLINVLIGLPAVIVAMASQVSRLASWFLPRVLLLASLAVFVALFPSSPRFVRFPTEYLTEPWERFDREQQPHPSAWESEHGIAFKRAGGFVSGEYRIFSEAMPARVFFEAMEEAKGVVGDQPTLVHSFPQVPPEIVYFFADLRPGPVLFNFSTMVLNTEIQERYRRHMEAHCAEFGAVIGTDPTAREVTIFKRCHSALDEIPKTVSGRPYYIWVSHGSPFVKFHQK